jgi:hypothetical protein
MSNLQPKLRTLPPKSGQQSALDRLGKLSDWTEEPSRDTSAVIAPLETPPKPTENPVSEIHTPTLAKESRTPWTINNAPPIAVRSMNFKLPIDLYQKLKWLSETTYGYNMTRILIEALEEKTTQMLKDSGHS